MTRYELVGEDDMRLDRCEWLEGGDGVEVCR